MADKKARRTSDISAEERRELEVKRAMKMAGKTKQKPDVGPTKGMGAKERQAAEREARRLEAEANKLLKAAASDPETGLPPVPKPELSGGKSPGAPIPGFEDALSDAPDGPVRNRRERVATIFIDTPDGPKRRDLKVWGATARLTDPEIEYQVNAYRWLELNQRKEGLDDASLEVRNQLAEILRRETGLTDTPGELDLQQEAAAGWAPSQPERKTGAQVDVAAREAVRPNAEKVAAGKRPRVDTKTKASLEASGLYHFERGTNGKGREWHIVGVKDGDEWIGVPPPTEGERLATTAGKMTANKGVAPEDDVALLRKHFAEGKAKGKVMTAKVGVLTDELGWERNRVKAALGALRKDLQKVKAVSGDPVLDRMMSLGRFRKVGEEATLGPGAGEGGGLGELHMRRWKALKDALEERDSLISATGKGSNELRSASKKKLEQAMASLLKMNITKQSISEAIKAHREATSGGGVEPASPSFRGRTIAKEPKAVFGPSAPATPSAGAAAVAAPAAAGSVPPPPFVNPPHIPTPGGPPPGGPPPAPSAPPSVPPTAAPAAPAASAAPAGATPPAGAAGRKPGWFRAGKRALVGRGAMAALGWVGTALWVVDMLRGLNAEGREEAANSFGQNVMGGSEENRRIAEAMQMEMLARNMDQAANGVSLGNEAVYAYGAGQDEEILRQLLGGREDLLQGVSEGLSQEGPLERLLRNT